MAHVHEGHRARMRQRLMSEGLDGFHPHEVLELLLYYTIPMRDVNPLAHQLIAHFGSLPKVLSASEEQLMRLPGVGLSTAQWLHSVGPMLDCYDALRFADRPKLDRLKSVTSYAQTLFGEDSREQLWTINMNLSGYLLHSALLPTRQKAPSLPHVVELALRYHAQAVVLLQCRPSERMQLSPEDIAFTGKLDTLLCSLGVQLMDNVLMCGGECLSLRERGILRTEAPASALAEPDAPSLHERWLDA